MTLNASLCFYEGGGTTHLTWTVVGARDGLLWGRARRALDAKDRVLAHLAERWASETVHLDVSGTGPQVRARWAGPDFVVRGAGYAETAELAAALDLARNQHWAYELDGRLARVDDTTREVTVASDASVSVETGRGAWAWFAGEDQVQVGVVSTRSPHTAELAGLVAALGLDTGGRRLTVLCDSRTVLYGLGRDLDGSPTTRRQHVPEDARELNEQARALLGSGNTRVEWVRGHHGHPLNERADTLARNVLVNQVRDYRRHEPYLGAGLYEVDVTTGGYGHAIAGRGASREGARGVGDELEGRGAATPREENW